MEKMNTKTRHSDFCILLALEGQTTMQHQWLPAAATGTGMRANDER